MRLLVDSIYPKLTNKMLGDPKTLTFRHPLYPGKSGIYFGLFLGKLYARELDSFESMFEGISEIKKLLKLDNM